LHDRDETNTHWCRTIGVTDAGVNRSGLARGPGCASSASPDDADIHDAEIVVDPI
jgi:hypothetical protein